MPMARKPPPMRARIMMAMIQSTNNGINININSNSKCAILQRIDESNYQNHQQRVRRAAEEEIVDRQETITAVVAGVIDSSSNKGR
mmetsp:Transcript_16507/g.35990  ORF Transcript_16507/g.35990 Transcript_16507/m.35990 type:complete len:86 (+) Transcript_16507:894-1151(+)